MPEISITRQLRLLQLLWACACLSACSSPGACDSVGVLVKKEIGKIAGYEDSTGNGCNFTCELDLWNGSVDYVEFAYAEKRYQLLVNVGDTDAVSFRRPTRDGLYRAELKADEKCADRPPSQSRRYEIHSFFTNCLELVPIERISAGYQMTGTFSKRTSDEGAAYLTRWRFTDSSGTEVASASSYRFVWNRQRQIAPDLPSDYRCPDLFKSVIDLRLVYAEK